MAPAKYTEEDLEVLSDPVGSIRKHSEMFLKDGPKSAALVSRAVNGLIVSKSFPINIDKSGDWFAISSGVDWLLSDEGSVSIEPFYKLIPIRGHGLFHDRFEVFITAFADCVLTVGSDGLRWISGDPSLHEPPREFLLEDVARSRQGRMVAFRCS